MALYKQFQFLKFRRSPALVVFIEGAGIPEAEVYDCLLFRPHLIDKRIWADYKHFSDKSEEVILKDIFENELKPLKKVPLEFTNRAKEFIKLLHNERQDLIDNLEYLEFVDQIENYVNAQK